MSEHLLHPLELVDRLDVAIRELVGVECAIAALDRERTATRLAELADRRRHLRREIYCLLSTLDVVADEIVVHLGGTGAKKTLQ